MTEARSGAAATVLNSKIYVCGGWNGERALSTVEFYDSLSRRWFYIHSMPSPSYGLTTISNGSHIIVMSNYNRGIWSLNTEEDGAQWMILPPLKDSRQYFTVTKVGNEMVVVGGKNAKESLLSVEIYNGFTWNSGPSLPKAFYGHSCVVLSDETMRFMT